MATATQTQTEWRREPDTRPGFHVLQAGLPKSGNLWLYRIIQGILDQASCDYVSFVRQYRDFVEPTGVQDEHELFGHDVIEMEKERCFARFNRHSRIVIHDLRAYVDACTHLWTHSPATPMADELFPLLDKVVYIMRDPRDAAISAANWVFTPKYVEDYQQEAENPEAYLDREFLTLLKQWANNVGSYLKASARHSVYFIFYENVLEDPQREIEQLAGYLGFALTPEAVTAVREATSFDAMAAKENPGHVRRGRANKWVDDLNKRQQKLAGKVVGPMMDLLHYPKTPTAIDESRPAAPESVNPDDVHEMLKHVSKFK